MGKASGSIYSDGRVVIPMFDVQHVEKCFHSRNLADGTMKGDLSGIRIITKHTTWNTELDDYDNAIWIGANSGHAQKFIKCFCDFRSEIDNVMKGGE